MKRDFFDEWNEHLNDEEKKALEETLQEWERDKSGTEPALAYSLSFMKEAERTFPGVSKVVGRVTREVLQNLRDYARFTVDESAIEARVSLKCSEALEIRGDLAQIPVSVLDGAAKDCLRFNIATAGIEGTLTGLIGFAGFALDIPIIYTVLFRLIQEVALCYGYSIDTPEEKLYILKILELGHQVDGQSRNETITDLYTLHSAIRGGISLNQIERTGIMKSFQALCGRIGISFSKRKLSALFMVVGGVVGGGMNYLLAREMADAAFHTYRKRVIMDRAMARRLNRI